MRAADEHICVGPPEAALSYRNIPNVLSAAEVTGARMRSTPGTAFYQKTPIAEVCESIGVKFIGPDVVPKTSPSWATSPAAQVAVKAGFRSALASSKELRSEQDAPSEAAKSIGFPVIIKAPAGGGGRGMRVVNKAEELARAFQAAQAEAKSIRPRRRLSRTVLSRVISRSKSPGQPGACRAPRGTRLLHPTAPSKACRGNLVPGGR
ncbi:MAG: biotin carboxylase N-terminal domain-containing protein [Nitrospiraceae bacterium]